MIYRDFPLDGIALRQAQEKEVKRLKEDRANGLLSENDYYLLLGRRVYGRPLRKCAAELQIGYELAKKRYQRAAARLGLVPYKNFYIYEKRLSS